MISFSRSILLSLAVFGDIVRVLPTNKKQAWNFWFGDYRPIDRVFNRRSFTSTVSRLLKTQRMEKVVEGGRVRMKITPKGLKFLSLSLDLRKFSHKPWDKKWRVVIFDIPERKRNQREGLRRKLKELGFGMLQESVWITPFPIANELEEYFSDWRIQGEILISESRILVGDQKEIVNRVWRILRLVKKYHNLIRPWLKVKSKYRNQKMALKFQRSYFELLSVDPFLPKELLPQPWIGESAEKIYLKEVLKILVRSN